MSSLPHFLDSRLTDGCEIVSLTCWLLLTSRKIHNTQGHRAAGSIRSIEKSLASLGMNPVTVQSVTVLQPRGSLTVMNQ
jgi:hypothetical protein